MRFAQPIRVELNPHGPRVYIAGRRLHHGLVGLALLLSDAHDWRVWLRDLFKHPSAR